MTNKQSLTLATNTQLAHADHRESFTKWLFTILDASKTKYPKYILANKKYATKDQ